MKYNTTFDIKAGGYDKTTNSFRVVISPKIFKEKMKFIRLIEDYELQKSPVSDKLKDMAEEIDKIIETYTIDEIIEFDDFLNWHYSHAAENGLLEKISEVNKELERLKKINLLFDDE